MLRVALAILTLCLDGHAQEPAEVAPATPEIDARLARIEHKLAMIEDRLAKTSLPVQDAEFQIRVRMHSDGSLSILGRTIGDDDLAETLAALGPLFQRGRVMIALQSDFPHDRLREVLRIVKRALPKASIAFAAQTIEAEQGGAGEPATRVESDSEGGDKPQPESEGRSR